ncbi:MAG: hypothetical protein AAF126_02425 [Chloroflexota bacterium]
MSQLIDALIEGYKEKKDHHNQALQERLAYLTKLLAIDRLQVAKLYVKELRDFDIQIRDHVAWCINRRSDSIPETSWERERKLYLPRLELLLEQEYGSYNKPTRPLAYIKAGGMNVLPNLFDYTTHEKSHLRSAARTGLLFLVQKTEVARLYLFEALGNDNLVIRSNATWVIIRLHPEFKDKLKKYMQEGLEVEDLRPDFELWLGIKTPANFPHGLE